MGMIPFVDLQSQYRAYQSEIDAAIAQVLASGAFINGPEVSRLEEELAAYCGAHEAIACSSGTDALLLALMALDLRPGDEVIVPMKGEDMNDQPEGVKCYDWFFCTRPLPKEEIEKKLGKGYEIKG